MIGQNIKRLRTENQMTQKALADKLFVTAQAVSRWENEEVEPSLSTVTEIARIFNVSADEILGLPEKAQTEPVETEPKEKEPEPKVEVRTEYVYKEAKPVLGVCEICNNPIYEPDDLIRDSDNHIFCKSCKDKKDTERLNSSINAGIHNRHLAFGWSIVAAIAVIVAGIITCYKLGNWVLITAFAGGSLAIFTLVSCCILDNNFIGEMVESIFSWGFVKFPGVIFELDLDGIIWLLTVKLFFWIIGIILACASGALAIAIGGVMSLFVYPYAIAKNYKHPEKFFE